MRNMRSGFTLIELLIVVVIIGILAAIAIPKFGETRTKANESAMKAELRNLLTAQESYFGDANTYGTLDQLTASNLWTTPTGFTSSNVAVAQGSASFAGTLTKAGRKCEVLYSLTPAAAAAATNGQVLCTAA